MCQSCAHLLLREVGGMQSHRVLVAVAPSLSPSTVPATAIDVHKAPTIAAAAVVTELCHRSNAGLFSAGTCALFAALTAQSTAAGCSYDVIACLFACWPVVAVLQWRLL